MSSRRALGQTDGMQLSASHTPLRPGDVGWAWGLASELQPLLRCSVCDADGQTERHSNPEVSELIIKQLGTIDTILSLCFLVGIFGVCFNI